MNFTQAPVSGLQTNVPQLTPAQRSFGSTHRPLRHSLPPVHALPHAPQLATVDSEASHPSVCLFPLQSAHPAEHVPPQAPLLQVGDAMWLFEQDFPQAPQFVTVVSVASQPSVCLLPLQSYQPAKQAPLQVPAVQLAVTWLVEQTTPHPPQLETLVVAVSQPSVILLALQSAHPALHAPSQVPVVQLAEMWFVEQVFPHPPQLVGVASDASQPSDRLSPLQSAHPALHVPPQTPPVQVAET